MARCKAIRELEGLPNWPGFLTKPMAAAYLALSDDDFDCGVACGALPAPRDVLGRALWPLPVLERFCDSGVLCAARGAASAPDPIAARIARVGRVR